GEGTVGALYDRNGTLLTPSMARLDLLQQIGDEDDPDVIYLPGRDAFLYLSNTDNSNGSTGTLGNRVVGSLVEAAPDAGGKLVVRPEQPLSDGEPAGRAEGHPASIENPFNGQLITAYDGGNGTAVGDLSYFDLGTAPNYTFTAAQPEVPYLNGASGDPLTHQHPQLAADPNSGVILVGFNAAGSTIGIPDGYVFLALGPDGQPLPSQLGAPYLLADSPGGLGTTVNFHTLRYSPTADAFLAAFTSNPGVTYLASLQVTSSHLAPTTAPSLTVARSGANLLLSWPAAATGYQLDASASLVPAAWQPAGLTPTVNGDRQQVTVTPNAGPRFFRLSKP
ncbi:MAG: hypothetical protein IT580_23580, partial [Verrucomicrobiales bacterium]|nr:hypothetical protein [Verrucomicrobiales bacterium]